MGIDWARVRLAHLEVDIVILVRNAEAGRRQSILVSAADGGCLEGTDALLYCQPLDLPQGIVLAGLQDDQFEVCHQPEKDH